ncbi:hypothetical protein RGU77_09825 [Actimicrobium sp. CCI2.3]|nr:hypothetical protein [Actimicrobium sp. CCI2.3]MDY7574581.1 hypothetical protein [Actimicrobium sp. CCI2.3]MEB0020957.1 hypothetical protein [Actimicrobium sp. CCI2.3]
MSTESQKAASLYRESCEAGPPLGGFERLDPYAGKPACPVLRGLEAGNRFQLLDTLEKFCGHKSESTCATILPLLASIAKWSVRHVRRDFAPCFAASH